MRRLIGIFLGLAVFASKPAFAGVAWLDDLEMNQEVQPWGHPHRNLSADRTPLTIDKHTYPNGVGVQAASDMWIALGRGTATFKASVGVDDIDGGNTAEFVVAVDGKVLFDSGIMHKGDPAKEINVDVLGKSYMLLAVKGGAKADWADAHFDTTWSEPTQAEAERSDPYILTPKPGPAPHLNNAVRYGVRPNAPVQYTIPCTGERPIKFTAAGLPDGLTIDPDRGWIIGKSDKVGEYPLTLIATNAKGTSTRKMTIVVGDKLCLTPPMGWSSWNVWCAAPSQERALAAADAMVKFDLINHGFTYVNIDDGWQGLRGGQFNGIQPDPVKFPDMHGLIESVHGMGLKFGVYSGPWICSYCGYTGGSSNDPKGAWDPSLRKLPDDGHIMGKYNLAENDANEWASWGVDYLKYDWYPNKAPEIIKMSDALRATGRDIVYSVSNSAKISEADVLAKYAQLWRASGDIRDTWPSLRLNGFGDSEWAARARPGAWPDPDMLVVGNVGFGQEGWGQITRPSKLSPDEQYTHVSLWSLLASPLILGCDLQKLDPFTIGLITNDEVLAVDQDPLGKAAKKVADDYFHEVWTRPLYDGSTAAGLFNVSPSKRKFRLTPGDLHVTGRQIVRDVWRQKDLGELGDGIDAEVPAHGVLLVVVRPVK